ncbi:MAG: CAP domain-containing protein [Benjaminiella poitrasii]|nr:MAG: CAP domain-containing protein [Benjaminiella poitrasii]
MYIIYINPFFLAVVFSLLSLFLVANAAISFDNKREILELHNQLREKHNSPKLTWSSWLALKSQSFVNKCNFNYETTTDNHPNSTNNIALGHTSWNNTIYKGWYQIGKKYYNYEKPGYNERAGPFIAMIWKSSTHIGCKSFDCGKHMGRIYQCEYYPSIPIESIFDKKEYVTNVQR